MSASNESTTDNRLKLPDYFPYATKPCKLVANDYLNCFSTHAMSMAIAEDSTRASSIASDAAATTGVINTCEAELKKYRSCMEGKDKTWLGYAATTPVEEKRFRVQDEYRNK